ncbi:MAG TPA: LLM class flavin-dependent oxidoreductase, partial [Candidatus Binataceae bacterium]|nr:LLM class flavin-dependent oxidoreductase [Candidatus Binataceae bacterium]
MKVGGAVIFQNPFNERSDYEVYQRELKIGDLYEPLGFDSIWSVEHHFDDYTMCPDVLQFLSYYAGRTKNIQLGSMVVVLPWHDPIRVAEQVSVVDHQSNGRMLLGLGRGLARIEFEGFRVPLGESRERFIEYAEMIIEGLEKGYCEFDGKYL